MKVVRYNKLIRDRIPEIIQAAGANCLVKKLNQVKYRHYLVEKLEEETKELKKFNNKKQLVNELIDLQEIIDAIAKEFKLNKNKLIKEQRAKRLKRGGFAQKLFLIKTIEK